MVVWTHVLFWMSYMHEFYILVFLFAQRSWACVTWKCALEIIIIIIIIIILSVWAVLVRFFFFFFFFFFFYHIGTSNLGDCVWAFPNVTMPFLATSKLKCSNKLKFLVRWWLVKHKSHRWNRPVTHLPFWAIPHHLRLRLVDSTKNEKGASGFDNLKREERSVPTRERFFFFFFFFFFF